MWRLAPLLFPLLLVGCSGDGPVDEPDEEMAATAHSVLAPLSVDERVERIRSLQTGLTDRDNEQEILALFQAVRGEELRQLKRTLDDGMNSYHLLHLVYSDIDDEGIRAELLAHLATSAEGLDVRPIRVLSDIDDTIYASLHDARFPKGTTYPGVLAFYRELATADGEAPGVDGFVTFISARPGDRAGAVEAVTLDKLVEFGFERATLLAGTFSGLASHEAMADAKYDNLDRYRVLYPEYRFVFVGDSGQGDAAFGARVLRDFPDDVLAVFIHDVVNEEAGKLALSAEQRAEAAADRIFYFDSYPEAARLAASIRLLPAEAVARVEEAAAPAEEPPTEEPAP